MTVKVVILGCGRMGAMLARELADEGHTVSVVDKNPDSFAWLGEKFKGKTVPGPGIDREVLSEAGLDDADVFFAMTSGDNTNVVAAQMAKMVFNVPTVIARIFDPVRREMYSEFGILSFSTTLMGVASAKELLSAARDAKKK